VMEYYKILKFLSWKIEFFHDGKIIHMRENFISWNNCLLRAFFCLLVPGD
jgi:hypothetical protein